MNQQLAIIGQNFVVSWFAIFCFLGCLAGLLMACILRKTQKQQVSDVFIVVTFAVPLGLILSRLFYCLFVGNISSTHQIFRFTDGGYGLYGAIFGVFLAAVLTGIVFRMRGLGKLFDCLAVGGALAIAVGRFATYFSGAEIGYEVPFKTLTVYKITDKIHLLAVYWLDGGYETVIWLVCLLFYCIIRKKGKNKSVDGVTALLMLALHGTNAVVMESLRSDALTFGPNQVFKISQLLGAACYVVITSAFIVKTAKNEGGRLIHKILVLVMLLCMVAAGIAEWRVGKNNYVFLHVLILTCMIVLDTITVYFSWKAVAAAKTVETESLTEAEQTAVTEEPSEKVSREKKSSAKSRRRISKNEADSIMAAFKDTIQSEDESLL